MRALVVAALLPGASYSDDLAKWRSEYEAGLKRPDGWLSVAGLFWLHEGANSVGSAENSDVMLPKGLPARAGAIRFDRGVAVWTPAGGSAKTMKPDVASVGRVSFTIVKRGIKTGVRLRDPDAATRRNFGGTKWFAAADASRVKARWTSYRQPKQVMITNILGMKTPAPSPGYAEFTAKGRMMRLEELSGDNELFFMFRDATSGRDTYDAGRFLYTGMPHGDSLEIDFNRAHNPPCAFTPYATCPLPPRQNTPPIAVDAGEKRYGSH